MMCYFAGLGWYCLYQVLFVLISHCFFLMSHNSVIEFKLNTFLYVLSGGNFILLLYVTEVLFSLTCNWICLFSL